MTLSGMTRSSNVASSVASRNASPTSSVGAPLNPSLNISLDPLGAEGAPQSRVDLARRPGPSPSSAPTIAPMLAPRDAVDGVARLLEHLERADVRVALGAAGAEREAELRPGEVAAEPGDVAMAAVHAVAGVHDPGSSARSCGSAGPATMSARPAGRRRRRRSQWTGRPPRQRLDERRRAAGSRPRSRRRSPAGGLAVSSSRTQRDGLAVRRGARPAARPGEPAADDPAHVRREERPPQEQRRERRSWSSSSAFVGTAATHGRRPGLAADDRHLADHVAARGGAPPVPRRRDGGRRRSPRRARTASSPGLALAADRRRRRRSSTAPHRRDARPRCPRRTRPSNRRAARRAVGRADAIDPAVGSLGRACGERQAVGLSRAEQRQLVDDPDPVRELVVGDLPAGELEQRGRGQLRALARDDERLQHLADLLVRRSDDRRLRDVGMREQERPRSPPGTTLNPATCTTSLARPVIARRPSSSNSAEVAGAEPAVGERRRGLLRAPEVARRHPRAAHVQLAAVHAPFECRAAGARRSRIAPRGGSSRRQHGRRAELGHAVEVEHASSRPRRGARSGPAGDGAPATNPARTAAESVGRGLEQRRRKSAGEPWRTVTPVPVERVRAAGRTVDDRVAEDDRGRRPSAR